jgi:hypothetical protein
MESTRVPEYESQKCSGPEHEQKKYNPNYLTWNRRYEEAKQYSYVEGTKKLSKSEIKKVKQLLYNLRNTNLNHEMRVKA